MKAGYLLGLLAVAAMLAAGCETRYILRLPDGGAGGEAGTGGTGGTGGTVAPAVDAGEDSGTGCDGFCAPVQASGWDYASIVWFGDKKDAPGCPPDAASLAFEGYEELDGPHDCGTCTCSPPPGSCGLPGTMTANAASCAQNGTSTP